MNVIFLDIDGVLVTRHGYLDKYIEDKVKVLSDICHKYDCKIVISSGLKNNISSDFREIKGQSLKLIFNLFKKYDIECIGKTPHVHRDEEYSYYEMWKEDEIRLYLYRHPEVEHYVVIDDDDMPSYNSDLDKVRSHLVKTLDYQDSNTEEGLLPTDIERVGKVLSKENNIRKLLIKYKGVK